MKSTASSTETVASRILSIIGDIDRPAEFCTSGPCLAVLPGLQVDRVGDIALPLGAPVAKALIKLCRQAPYGKGTETVVDTKVRKV